MNPNNPNRNDGYGVYEPIPQHVNPPGYSESNTNTKKYNSSQPNDYVDYPQTNVNNSSAPSADDFLYGSSVADCDISIRHAFIFKVYSILTVQLLATAFFSILFSSVNSIQLFLFRNVWIVYVSMGLTIVNMILLLWKRHSYPLNFALLSSFTILESVGLGVTISFYSQLVVLQALILTLGIFIVLTLIALQSKYDFTSWQPYLGVALWIVILLSFVQIFFPFGSTFELFIAIGTAILFCGYILVDTHMLMSRLNPDEYIVASVELYLDILNLFLAILRILGSSNDRD
ncbi:UPF0005-domain-containing protein [Neoconidiobolus thromboides FSU 785]|nr:UPF0005-domain-containing protein [Neoconidiobolus thromboides FSU 785]